MSVDMETRYPIALPAFATRSPCLLLSFHANILIPNIGWQELSPRHSHNMHVIWHIYIYMAHIWHIWS